MALSDVYSPKSKPSPSDWIGLSNPWSATSPSVEADETPPDLGQSTALAHTTNLPHPYDPAPPQPNIIRDVYGPQLSDVGSKLQSAYAAPHAGMARQVLGALLSKKNPALGGLVSGETQRQRAIEPLQEEYGLISNIISANRAQQTTDITNQMHQAQTNWFNTRAQTAGSPVPKTPQEQAVADYMTKINPATKKNYSPAEALKQVNQDAQDVKPDPNQKPSEEDKAISDYMGANKLQDTPANRNKARIAVAQQKRTPQDQDLADINKQLKKAQLEKAMEATPDEQRRADLANNLEENLNNLEDIAKRRPELFGPWAGRKTGAKQVIGWNDPDIAALKVIEEQTGLAMVGAHAMRNAQHAEKAAQSITGANHTPAEALLAPNGPIAKARESLATFKADAGRRRQAITGESATPNNAPPAGAKIRDYTTLQP